MQTNRGVTLVEFMAASSIATLIAGGVVVMMTSASDLGRTQSMLAELATSIDVASTSLRQDIWQAVDVCNPNAEACAVEVPLCPAPVPCTLLALRRPGVNQGTWDIQYRVDPDPNRPGAFVLNRRDTLANTARTVARQIAMPGTSAGVGAAASDPLVTVTLATNLIDVRGRNYTRQTNVSYRTQIP